MAFEQLNRKNRAIGAAGALAINALLVLALLSLSNGIVPLKSAPGLVVFDVSRPPPAAPPPRRKPAGAAAPTSRGATEAPSPAKPPHPLPKPTPAQPSVDVGSQSATGAGSAAGSGAGQGGQGTGSGGSGTGAGGETPPLHIAGALTDADYARTSHPRGAQGTVYIAFRVRTDGSVDQCRVTRTSGYPAIDAATCRLVEQRFRFRPALDPSGRAIDYTLNTDFTWRPR